MKSRLTYCLCCALAAAVCLSSCAKKERVIPRGRFAKIYAEMFIADQRLTTQGQKVRTAADTSWVYEPIFEKYGYNSDDYRASVAYYIRDANRFARILRQTASIIDGEIKDLKKQKRLLEMMEDAEGMGDRFLPEIIYNLTGLDNPNIFATDSLAFYVDSTGGEIWFDARDWADTAYYGPVMVLRSDIEITETADSLAASADTLGIVPVADTLGIVPVADTLGIVSPAVKPVHTRRTPPAKRHE